MAIKRNKASFPWTQTQADRAAWEERTKWSTVAVDLMASGMLTNKEYQFADYAYRLTEFPDDHKEALRTLQGRVQDRLGAGKEA